MPRSHSPSAPRTPPFFSGLQLLLSVVAVSFAAALWVAGRYTVVSPTSARALFFAALICGLMSFAVALWLRMRPLPVLLGGVGGLSATLAAALFPWALVALPKPPIERWVPASSAAPSTASSTSLAAEAKSDGDRHLRVVQWNVLHGYPELDNVEGRSAALVNLLKQSDADVFILQEVPSLRGHEPLAERLASDLGFDTVFSRANGSRRLLGFEEGIAVSSRFPIRSVTRLPLAPNGGVFERRIALLTEIEGPRGPVSVVGLHVHPGDPAVAEAQARALLEELEARSDHRADASADMPLVIAGDFNLDSGSAAIKAFEAAGYVDVVVGGAAGGIDHLLIRETSGWQSLWGESRLATAPQSNRARDVDGWAPISDHPLLIAELETTGPPETSGWRGGWSVESASDHAVDRQKPGADSVGADWVDRERLDRAIVRISELDGIECILVAREGRLLADVYLRGARPGELRNIKSASKSVLSAVVGIAVERGDLELDDPVSLYLPAARALDDPLKRSITVENLLGMRSGLESTSFGNYGSWVSSRNWVASALSRPLVDGPGTRRRYSTGDTHLLSAMVAAATGTSTLAYAEQHLFRPLGIERFSWQKDPQGIHFGGNNLSLTARDLARFGQLYLDRGRFGDVQVVSHGWVARSTRTRQTRQPGEWGRYGWLWWLRPPEERGAFSANGFGGQYLYLSPAHDLVVVIASTEVSKGRAWRQELFEQIVDGIAGSMETREGPFAGLPLR